MFEDIAPKKLATVPKEVWDDPMKKNKVDDKEWAIRKKNEMLGKI